MKPAMFRDMTHVLDAPEGWETEEKGECLGLPVAIDQEQRTVTSCWVLDPEEVVLISQGGRVFLTCHGSQPPVTLSVRAKE